MPQALEQLGHQLQVNFAQDAIRMDTGEQPAAPVAEVLGALDDAATALRDLSTALHRAASPLFHMAAQ
jgi:molybdopterin/thiamine biosynthesis adenylyltransferase